MPDNAGKGCRRGRSCEPAAQRTTSDLTPLIDISSLIFFIPASFARASTSTCLRRTAAPGRVVEIRPLRDGSSQRGTPWPAPTSARSCADSARATRRAPDSWAGLVSPTRRWRRAVLIVLTPEVRAGRCIAAAHRQACRHLGPARTRRGAHDEKECLAAGIAVPARAFRAADRPGAPGRPRPSPSQSFTRLSAVQMMASRSGTEPGIECALASA